VMFKNLQIEFWRVFFCDAGMHRKEQRPVTVDR